MDAKLDQIREKMEQSRATRWAHPTYNRVRCPSLKQMAFYINERVDGLTAEMARGEDTKMKMAGQLIWSSSTVEGNVITIRNRKGKVIRSHNATETYRYNGEIADFILEVEEDGGYYEDHKLVKL